MSGIQIHAEDPISPIAAGGINPKTIHNAGINTSSATTTTAAFYPPARPGAAAPTPTKTVASASSSGPPHPQPGAVPATQPPRTTARPSLPPPPKTGERPHLPECYAPIRSVTAQPKPYPSYLSQHSPVSGPKELSSGSTKSTTTDSTVPTSTHSTSLPTSAQASARASLEHPPGYCQNPYASDLTPDQRFATELLEEENRSDSLPSLGYNDTARLRANSVVDDDESVWNAARKWGTEGINWGKEKGKQLGDLHEQVWGSIGRK